MLTASARQLRHNLGFYLDKLEEGEEITIIRHSLIIGYLKPIEEAKKSENMEYALNEGSKIIFRRAWRDDSPAAMQLHIEALKATGAYMEPTPENAWHDFDLEDVWNAYIESGGDFLVGELDGEIVAMGGFKKIKVQEAELKRMRVKPGLQGQGVGKHLLGLLEARAKDKGYRSIILDTTDKQEAARHLYETHGYKEFKREKTKQFELIYYRKKL